MPLGGLLKSEVREIAARHGLRTATKPESREICFVADNDYRRFLSEYEASRGRSFESGEIVHENGSVLGRHDGTAFYTIGQRKGLGVTSPRPLYVQRIDTETNRVIVGEEDSLYQAELLAERINWSARSFSAEPFDADVKIRYLHQPARSRVVPLTEQTARVIFTEKQRAVTPGQSVVFYDDDIMLGGGLIANVH
jgi:tRNA-specific 2-thiouridylase